MWALGMKPVFSAKAIYALNCWAVSSLPAFPSPLSSPLSLSLALPLSLSCSLSLFELYYVAQADLESIWLGFHGAHRTTPGQECALTLSVARPMLLPKASPWAKAFLRLWEPSSCHLTHTDVTDDPACPGKVAERKRR